VIDYDDHKIGRTSVIFIPKVNIIKQACLTVFIFSISWVSNFFTNFILKTKIERFISDSFKANDLKGPIFDYYVDPNSFEYKSWSEHSLFQIQNPQEIIYNKVFIPLVENIPYYYITELYLKLAKPICFMGKPSSGKSLMINKILNTLETSTKNVCNLRYLLNYNTNSNKIENYLSNKLVYLKRNLIGDYFDKEVILFLDDVNLEKCDKFNSQTSIEFLRKLDCHKKIYDMKSNVNLVISKLKIISCANVTSQRNNLVVERYIHSANIISQNSISEEGIKNLFKSNLETHLQKYIPKTCSITSNQYVQLSNIFLTFVNESFRPSPNKLHYKYNLRNLSRVFQGIHFFSYKYENTDYPRYLIKIWFFEITRVFEDGLTTIEDKKFFQDNLIKTYNNYFRYNN